MDAHAKITKPIKIWCQQKYTVVAHTHTHTYTLENNSHFGYSVSLISYFRFSLAKVFTFRLNITNLLKWRTSNFKVIWGRNLISSFQMLETIMPKFLSYKKHKVVVMATPMLAMGAMKPIAIRITNMFGMHLNRRFHSSFDTWENIWISIFLNYNHNLSTVIFKLAYKSRMTW